MDSNNKIRKQLFYWGIGIILSVLLLNIIIENPSPYLYTMYKLLSSIGTSAIIANMPGYFHVQFMKQLKMGGAIAVFFAIFYFYPISSQGQLFKGTFSEIKCSETQRYIHYLINNTQTLAVKEGDKIDILNISGKQSFGPIVGTVGPEGKNIGLFNIYLDRYSYAKNIAHGALIYRMSNSEKWIKMLDTKEINIDRDCSMEIDINDKEKENNFGFYLVELRISSSK